MRAAILAHRRVALLLSGGHVPVGGTQVKDGPECATGSSTLASAAIKGFPPKAGCPRAGTRVTLTMAACTLARLPRLKAP